MDTKEGSRTERNDGPIFTAKRLQWLGHVEHRGDNSAAKTVLKARQFDLWVDQRAGGWPACKET